jgi:formylglycine-generating enzyme required for sulfatase activity
MPAPGTRVLLLSDVGALAAQPVTQAWAGFARALVQHGAQPVVWAPLAPRQIEVELTRWADVHCLQPAGGLRRQRGRIATDEQKRPKALVWLRCASNCWRTWPSAFASSRRCCAPCALSTPTPPPNRRSKLWSGRASRWFSDSGVSRAVSAEYVETYRQAFAELAAVEQLAALEVALHIHAWRGRATEAAEVLIWQAHARPEAQAGAVARLAEARGWFAAFSERATRVGNADPQLRAYALDLFARNGADQRWVAANSQWLSPVWLATGARESPPALGAEHLAQAVAARTDLPEVDCQLGVSDEGLMLWGAGRPAGPGHSRLGSPLQIKRLQVSDADGKPMRLHDPAAGVQRIATAEAFAGPAGALTLVAGHHRYLVSRIERPEWADEIGRDTFGLYVDIHVQVSQGTVPDGPQTVIQRLRYIEPGHFLMGSPESEADRFSDEGPQHAVTLTKGFWLADSACTQALWQAVMGDNPSHFISGKGDGGQHPVENVSWDDVQRFLRGLEKLLPGTLASLPSEAEWEYACRAGTRTPFSFGDNISPEEVNYSGEYPYKQGRKGLNRGATVPVRSLPANPWGLYEMHGNVWEWCADGLRDYVDRDETDPMEPDRPSRVLRGGVWSYNGGLARCARRIRYEPDDRLQSIGFRFALRSRSSAGATEWPVPRDGADGAAGRGPDPAPGTGAAFAAARSAAAPSAGEFPAAAVNCVAHRHESRTVAKPSEASDERRQPRRMAPARPRPLPAALGERLGRRPLRTLGRPGGR